jgi:hypothetical protein
MRREAVQGGPDQPRRHKEELTECKKILQNGATVFGEDAFGMELDAPDGKGFVADTHDFAFVGGSGDFKAIGECVAFDDEGMIAGGGERIGHVFEQLLFVVLNRRGFAVHHAVIDDDVGAEGVADALVAEADAENGNFAAEMANDIVGEAAFAG